MLRFRRILFNTLTAISLLLAIATAGLWVRSMVATDLFKRIRNYSDSEGRLFRDQSDVLLGLGLVSLYIYPATELEHRREPDISTTYSNSWRHVDLGASRIDETLFSRIARGMTFPTFETTDVKRITHIRLPLWMPAVLFVVLPTRFAYVTYRRRQQRISSLCPACGYDVRANPAKCSECGHEPAPATAPKRDGLTP